MTVSGFLYFDAGNNSDTVWIMQIEEELNFMPGAQVTLINGAREHNIFWQVAKETRIRDNAHAAGIILCKTAITFVNSGSTNGSLNNTRRARNASRWLGLANTQP